VKYAHGGQGSLRCPRRRADHESATRTSADEIKRLQRCINDLISLLALPAMWSGSKPGDIVPTLLDSLLRMLDLDLRVVSLTDLIDAAPSKTVRVAQSREQMFRPRNSVRPSIAGWRRPTKTLYPGTQSHWR